MKSNKKSFALAALLTAAFLAFTLCVLLVDRAPIAPNGTDVGFSTINKATLDALGASSLCYHISSVAGYISIATVIAFSAYAFIRFVFQKRFGAMDKDLFVLAGLYAALIALYLIFEIVVINYRPILKDGVAAASYPSSHTLLTVSTLSAAILQLRTRIKKCPLRTLATVFFALTIVAAVVCRLLSGIHWLTDIIGALLLSAALISIYTAAVALLSKKKEK